jgi:hypothetical protein
MLTDCLLRIDGCNVARLCQDYIGEKRLIMKRLVLAVIALVALAGSGPVAVAQEYKGPKLSVDQLTYHFGKVVQGEQAEHIFEIHSVGKESLVINRIQAS